MSQPGQELTLSNRERLETSGVQKVISFDEQEINLETVIGSLILRGEGMHITHLDLTAGDLVVEGLITSLEYSEQRSKKIRARGKNILERLIK
ncbi:MAG TPA: sporulation protein YabP [Syntrophomonadaceae bacterium]|nr:sporulation protein YabP [Syntrophomonadaceae bacterium]